MVSSSCGVGVAVDRLEFAADAYREACKVSRAAEIAASHAHVAATVADQQLQLAEEARGIALESLAKASGGTYFDAETRTAVYPE